jgi:hypothetical protein
MREKAERAKRKREIEEEEERIRKEQMEAEMERKAKEEYERRMNEMRLKLAEELALKASKQKEEKNAE